MKKFIPIISLGVLFLSLLLVVWFGQKGESTDLRSRAWNGVTANTESIRARLGGLRVPGEVKSDPKTTNTTQLQRLFTSLTRTYYNAEVQNISIPDLAISGVAFLAYDSKLDATFIYSRIANMPEPLVGALRLWLEGKYGDYQPAGIAEFIREKDVSVSYSVYTQKGDLRDLYRALIFSYDSNSNEASPEAQALQLVF